jgi:hypothetical protein
MEDCRDQTIDAFNEYVGSLRHGSTAGTRLSLTTFDSESVDVVHDTVRIEDIPKLTRETFVPRGMTPLFDALGQTVARIDKVTLLPDERIAFAILTDGLENASREYKAPAIRKILTERQEQRNWLVLYLGANQDAWAAGAEIGVQAAHAMSYSKAALQPAMESMARSMSRYRSAPKATARMAASFSDEERAQSMGQSQPPSAPTPPATKSPTVPKSGKPAS